jgi:hypothetical protein
MPDQRSHSSTRNSIVIKASQERLYQAFAKTKALTGTLWVRVSVTFLREISPPGTLWVPGLASLGCINL